MVHIDNPDNIAIMDWLVKSMKSVSGTIIINTEKEPAIQINAGTNSMCINESKSVDIANILDDFHNTSFFHKYNVCSLFC